MLINIREMILDFLCITVMLGIITMMTWSVLNAITNTTAGVVEMPYWEEINE